MEPHSTFDSRKSLHGSDETHPLSRSYQAGAESGSMVKKRYYDA